jgi:hypothetical protein
MQDHPFTLVPAVAARGTAAGASRPPIGPGWFDSSWDLRCGLEVVEEGQADLALRAWLDDFLGAPAAQPRLARVASPSAITAIA